MIRAFLFVALQSFKNRIIRRLRMLKQPRYLFGAILAALWFSQFFLRRGMSARRPLHWGQWPQIMLDGLAIPVLLVLLLAWLVPNQSLAFAPGEAHFLFGAPLRRRDILLYKLVRTQISVLISVTIMTFFRLPVMAAAGVWACLTTMGIYMMFVELGRARLRKAGVSMFWIVLTICIISGLIITAFVLLSHKPVHKGTPFDAPLLRVILFVPGLFSHAVLARNGIEIVTYAAAILALAATMFLIASSLRVPFEEIALDATERQLRQQERKKESRDGTFVAARRMPPLFRLKDGASPELAILWKNLVGVMRMSFPFVALFLGAFLVLFILGIALADDVAKMVCGAMCLFMTLILFFGGATALPQDLRHDVRRFDVLKSWPIAGERLVAASIAAPLLIISTLVLLFLTSGVLILGRIPDVRAHAPFAPEVIVIVFLFAVPACAAQLLLRNAAPVFFPAWAIRSKEEQRGFVALGQRLLTLLINLFVFCTMLLPAALVSLLGWWVAHRFAGGSPALLAAMTAPGVALLLLEVWLGIKFLGAQFDRLDVANELDAAAAGSV